MNQRLLLHELTREEARKAAPDHLVLLPVGAIEQHGPHLPVGTDFYTIDYVSSEAAAIAANQIPVLVAPALPFGSSDHHLPFGGTMSLSTNTYYLVISDLAKSLITSGFRRIFILNGHGGNNELIQLVARDLALIHPSCFAAASYWTVAWDALVELKAHSLGYLPGHAGVFETSQMMALHPELVREPRPHRDEVATSDPRSFYPAYRTEVHGAWQSIDGYTDSPDCADPNQGKAYLDAVVRSVAKAMVEFYSKTINGS